MNEQPIAGDFAALDLCLGHLCILTSCISSEWNVCLGILVWCSRRTNKASGREC